MTTSHITTHVLNTATGLPASGVRVVLEGQGSEGAGQWEELATASTDHDGRIRDIGPESVPPGNYRLRFDTASYFAAQSTETFFPEVALTFSVTNAKQHYHVPLLISPFAYSSYRGS